MLPLVTIRYSIIIARPREAVWDYTQDYTNRPSWDPAVLEATSLQESPARAIRLRMRGHTKMTFVYKLDDRPNKTSLVARDIVSPVLEKGGGSWTYEEVNGATRWTQTNTLGFKSTLLNRLLLPIYRRALQWQTARGMRRVKEILELADYRAKY